MPHPRATRQTSRSSARTRRFAAASRRRYGPPPTAPGINRTRHDVVDIFDEINEELRAERAQAWLKRYAGMIVATVVVIVVAAGGWEAWRWWQAKQDRIAGQKFLAAMTIAQAGKSDATSRKTAIADFDAIASTAPEGYRTLARLHAAALQAQSGNVAGAEREWNAIATDPNAAPLLRDLASLLWAEHQIDTADPSLLAARLKALAEPGNPWRPLADEQLALLDLRQGKIAAAKTTLTGLAEDLTAPQGVRGRAAALLGWLGG